MRNFLSVSLLLVCALSSGCASTFYPSVHFPDEEAAKSQDKNLDSVQKARQDARARSAEEAQYYAEDVTREHGNAEGSLFNPHTYSGLFEDRRARQVGDLLTIVISENIDSQQKNKTAVNTANNMAINTPGIGFPVNINPINKSGSSSSAFAGDGTSQASNVFSGTLSVVVTDVLPNGNLRVKGERQLGTNRDVEAVKFYGLVNPDTIQSGNRVVSTDVAEARIEYRGKGQIDSAQTMGWLSRFFLTVMPF